MDLVGASVIAALGFLVAFFLLRKLLRRDWIVIVAIGLILSILVVLTNGGPAISLVPVAVLLLVLLPIRLGLLAASVGLFVTLGAAISPITLDTSAWYFVNGLSGFAVYAGLSFYGYRIAVGSRRLLQPSRED